MSLKEDKCAMRKYQQAFVTGVAFVATVLFLVYKHEYDRLRGVMEVMEVFGDAHGRNISTSDSLSVSSFCKAVNLPPVPLPDSAARYLLDTGGSSWQSVGLDGMFVFSAHLLSHDDAPDEIVVLGVATPVHFRSQVEATVTRARRRMRPDHHDKAAKVTGTVKVLKSASSGADVARSGSSWEPVVISFPVSDDASTPLSLRFTSGGAGVPVISEVNTHLFGVRSSGSSVSRRSTGSAAVCMFLSGETSSGGGAGPGAEFPTLASAMAFYESAGDVREFWLYGQNELSFRDSGSVLPAAWESGLRLGALPWNFPFRGDPDRQRDLVLADCALRANGQKHHSPATLILVQPDEFIVPRIHHTVEAILETPSSTSSPLRVTFPVTYFCPRDESSGLGVDPLEAKEGRISDVRTAAVFQYPSAEKLMRTMVSGHPEMRTRDVPMGVGALLAFPGSCDKLALSGRKSTDMSLFKFRKSIETHEIFRHLRAFTKFL